MAEEKKHPLVEAGMPQHVLDRFEDMGHARAEQMMAMGQLPEGWRGHFHDWVAHNKERRT
jgi:hypothetical protein